MNMRFPQPIKVGDLIGLAVLDGYDLTIGYVRQVVRTPEGKIRLIVTQGGWLGPWFSFGSRLVAVPIEVVVILGRQLAAFDMPRQEFAIQAYLITDFDCWLCYFRYSLRRPIACGADRDDVRAPAFARNVGNNQPRIG